MSRPNTPANMLAWTMAMSAIRSFRRGHELPTSILLSSTTPSEDVGEQGGVQITWPGRVGIFNNDGTSKYIRNDPAPLEE